MRLGIYIIAFTNSKRSKPTMTNLKPDDKCQSTKYQDVRDKIEHCRTMLHLHDFLSDGENARVIGRISKWVEANKKKEADDGE